MNAVCGNAKLGSRGDGSRKLRVGREFWCTAMLGRGVHQLPWQEQLQKAGKWLWGRVCAQSQDLSELWESLPALTALPALPHLQSLLRQGTTLRTITEVAPWDPFWEHSQRFCVAALSIGSDSSCCTTTNHSCNVQTWCYIIEFLHFIQFSEDQNILFYVKLVSKFYLDFRDHN